MASAVTGKCFSTPNSCCNCTRKLCDKFTKDKKVDTSKRIKQLEVVVGSSFSSQAQESQPTTPSLNQIHGPLSASLSASRMLQAPASTSFSKKGKGPRNFDSNRNVLASKELPIFSKKAKESNWSEVSAKNLASSHGYAETQAALKRAHHKTVPRAHHLTGFPEGKECFKAFDSSQKASVTEMPYNKDANNNVSAPVMVLSQDMDSYSRLVVFSNERLQQIREDSTQLRNQRGRKKIKENGGDAFDEISAQISALLEKLPDSWGDRIDHLEGTIRPDIVATYQEEKIWGHSASSPYPSVIKAYSHCVNQKSIWPTVYML